MEISKLRVLQILVADPNLTRAAERLHVTQSALSKWIRSIETEIGCELFERRGPLGLKPLPQAVELAHLAERLSVVWEKGVNRIKRSTLEPNHFILVGPQLFLREILLPWWVQKSDQLPDLQLEVQVSSLDRVSLEALEMGADAAILENKEELPDYICKPIYTERWGIVRHPGPKPQKDMNRYLWGTYSTRHNPVDKWLVQTGTITSPYYHFYWEDLTAIAIWVSETQGAASVLPWHTVAWLVKRKKLEFDPLGPEATTRLYLAYPKKTVHRQFLNMFSDLSEAGN